MSLHDFTEIPARIGDKVETNPPKYVPVGIDYVDGVLDPREEQFFYAPYKSDYLDMMVMLNKTSPLGEGLLCSLSIKVQKHANKPYTEWSLPTEQHYNAKS